MTRKEITNIAIISAVAVTWSLFAGLVTWGLVTEDLRTRALGSVALERMLGVQQTRLSLTLYRIEQDLREEAAYVAVHDSVSDDMLIERWQPILESEWCILSIGVATENGGDRELARLSDRWHFYASPGGEGLPLESEWSYAEQRSAVLPRIGEPVNDPRRSLWFGEALGDRGMDPVWSITSLNDSTDRLHVSLLVRSPAQDKPYRVVRFAVAPERLVRSLGSNPTTHTEVFLGPRDLPWFLPDTGIDALAANAAVWMWRQAKTDDPFAFDVGGVPHMARIAGVPLNGSQIYAGAVLRLATLEQWTRDERKALWASAGLLVLLGGLMTWALLRGRRVDRLAERQERKSLTQERKLARAISEREILDREVHHRVKNNLQVVGSILNLQADRIADPQAKLEYMRGKRRIDSMALVHHKLYAQTDLRNIDLAVFLTQVANAMKAMFEPNSRSVSHSVDTDDLKLNADTSIQVGIILCEVLTNCYQHAFPYVTGGHIEISVRREDQDLFRLSVRDNGKGLVRDAERRELELGLELVEALAEQIDGRLEITVDNGTRVDILFRMQGDGSMRTI